MRNEDVRLPAISASTGDPDPEASHRPSGFSVGPPGGTTTADVTAARLHVLCDRLNAWGAALQTIAAYGDEDNEWDAVDRYARVRQLARDALVREDARITAIADARAPGTSHPHDDDRVNESSSSSSKGSAS